MGHVPTFENLVHLTWNDSPGSSPIVIVSISVSLTSEYTCPGPVTPLTFGREASVPILVIVDLPGFLTIS